MKVFALFFVEEDTLNLLDIFHNEDQVRKIADSLLKLINLKESASSAAYDEGLSIYPDDICEEMSDQEWSEYRKSYYNWVDARFKELYNNTLNDFEKMLHEKYMKPNAKYPIIHVKVIEKELVSIWS